MKKRGWDGCGNYRAKNAQSIWETEAYEGIVER